MPPLNNARQDEIDDFDADYEYLNTLGDDYKPEMIIAWSVVAISVSWIALIVYEVMR